jgi:hypothetical protein
VRALDSRIDRWRRSSRSTNNANCVEVVFAGQAVGLRDSKCAVGPVLVLPLGSFADLVACIR